MKLICTFIVAGLLTGCATNPVTSINSAEPTASSTAVTQPNLSPSITRLPELEHGMTRDAVHAIIGTPTSTRINGATRFDTYSATNLNPSSLAGCGLMAAATAGIGLLFCNPTKKSTATVTYQNNTLKAFTNPQ